MFLALASAGISCTILHTYYLTTASHCINCLAHGTLLLYSSIIISVHPPNWSQRTVQCSLLNCYYYDKGKVADSAVERFGRPKERLVLGERGPSTVTCRRKPFLQMAGFLRSIYDWLLRLFWYVCLGYLLELVQHRPCAARCRDCLRIGLNNMGSKLYGNPLTPRSSSIGPPRWT